MEKLYYKLYETSTLVMKVMILFSTNFDQVNVLQWLFLYIIIADDLIIPDSWEATVWIKYRPE